MRCVLAWRTAVCQKSYFGGLSLTNTQAPWLAPVGCGFLIGRECVRCDQSHSVAFHSFHTFHSPPYSWKFYSILMFILPDQTLKAVSWSYNYPAFTLIMLSSRRFDEEAQSLIWFGLRTVVKGPFQSILLLTLAKSSRADAGECTGHSGNGVLRQSIREGNTGLI